MRIKRRSNMKKERKEVKGNEVKELIKEVKLVVDYEYMCEEIKEKGVENKMNKEVKGVENKMNKEVKGVENKMNENKGGNKMNENKGGNKMNENKGGNKMDIIKEIETKKMLLVTKVVEWTESLKPVKNVNIKVKGRYYPLIEKETGKLFLIDKVQGKKVPFTTLDDSFKFIISCILAERKEEIEKEVEDGKRKYLEGKLQEINKLLDKF